MTLLGNDYRGPCDADRARGPDRLFKAIKESGWTKHGTRIEVGLPSPKLPSHRWLGGRTHVVRRSPTQVLGLDQHPTAIAHFVDVAEFCVEVTEADEAARNALCFLAGDQELPSVEAERAFLAYGRDGRDVRVCVEIKILRRGRAESSRRPPRHRRDACLISTQPCTLRKFKSVWKPASTVPSRTSCGRFLRGGSSSVSSLRSEPVGASR